MIIDIPIALITFYLFSAILVASSVMVVTAKNPVHSVLYLILSFFNAAGIFLLMGAELLAMTLIIVYVGAVAVLFLFVVMMFDFRAKEPLSRSFKIFSGCIGTVLLSEMVFLFYNWKASPFAKEGLTNPMPVGRTNAHSLGDILYTNYFLLFQLCGLILLVAIIGAIVLTLKDRTRSKRQDICTQVGRDPLDAVRLVKVKSGQGVKK
jgi:NADH-quinone oxidoreductase subunit J